MSLSRDNSHIGHLVVRIQNGDESARGELIDLTQASLFKFCLLLSHNREVAEDLCQETFIKSLQNIEKLKNPPTFLGWMYQIAKNIFIDHKRSAASKLTVSDQVMEEAGSTADLEEIINVQKILAQFSPEERFLLLLIELEGCSYKEAGDLAGLSEDAVRSKLHRLRQLFMQKFKATNGI